MYRSRPPLPPGPSEEKKSVNREEAINAILHTEDPKEARQKEEWAALKAMQIDDSLAEAHIAMAHVRTLYWNASN
jgi:hypothetical protein